MTHRSFDSYKILLLHSYYINFMLKINILWKLSYQHALFTSFFDTYKILLRCSYYINFILKLTMLWKLSCLRARRRRRGRDGRRRDRVARDEEGSPPLRGARVRLPLLLGARRGPDAGASRAADGRGRQVALPRGRRRRRSPGVLHRREGTKKERKGESRKAKRNEALTST